MTSTPFLKPLRLEPTFSQRLAASLVAAAGIVCVLLFPLDTGLIQRGVPSAASTVVRLFLQLTLAVYAGVWLRRLTSRSRWCPAELLLRDGRADIRWQETALPVQLTPRWVGARLIVLVVDDGQCRWPLPLFSHQLPADDFRRLRGLVNLGAVGDRVQLSRR